MGESSELPSHIIHDAKCQKAGMTAKWVRNDEISVTAFRPVFGSSVDKPSQFQSLEGTLVHHLRTPFIFEDPLLTELVADSNFIFKSVQTLKMSGSRSEYLKVSRSYRSTIRAYLEKVQEQIGFCGDQDLCKYESLITTFYTIEFLWHLCEILIIDPTSTNMVVGQLIGWIRFHYPQSERMAGEFLVTGLDVDSHDQYWATVRGQIMQGQVEVARALLKLHTAADTVPFQVTEQILKTIPTYSTYGGLSVQKFRSQWQYWVMDTETKLPLVTAPELETIIKLTTGDVETWNRQAANSESWYEFFPGFLFYAEPTCKYFELGTFANVWISRWAKAHGLGSAASACKMRLVDQIALHIIENDLHQVLHEIQSINDNQWFVTHLTDLLYNCGQLEVLGEQQISLTTQLRDALVFDYGSTLLAREDVWVQGIEYMEQAAEGRTALEVCLSRVHLKDETVAEEVIRQCQLRNYPAVESEVCKVMARKALNEGMLGDALVWAIKSQNNLFVAAVADIFLGTFRETGRMPCPEILENIGEKMFISPRLVFLIKFFDFHQFYEREEFPQAAELLVNLLDSKITPEFFWPILLADTIPLLESADPKIPSRETVQIIHHLETQFLPILEREREYQKLHDKSRILHNTRLDDVEKLIKLIRGASARNLARMLIIENTVAL